MICTYDEKFDLKVQRALDELEKNYSSLLTDAELTDIIRTTLLTAMKVEAEK